MLSCPYTNHIKVDVWGKAHQASIGSEQPGGFLYCTLTSSPLDSHHSIRANLIVDSTLTVSKQNGKSDKHSTNHFVVHKKRGPIFKRMEPLFTILAVFIIYALAIFALSVLIDLLLLFVDLILE